MVPDDVGVYVHYPWCRKLCPYCDFPVAIAAGEPPHQRYLDAVLAELAVEVPRFAGGRLVSIYFGGGTPSLWPPAQLAALIDAVRARFPRQAATLEVTLEANPTDCVPATIAAWMGAGINRLSIGVQSLRADELALLGRDHRHGDGLAAVRTAAATPGLAVSADFIGAVPVDDAPRAVPWLAELAATGVGHLSLYELTIEERTAFGKRHAAGRLRTYDDDVKAQLYVASHHALVAAGFEHYEISSYARPGARAIHNSLYWRGAPYLGLGVGAASFWHDGNRGERWTNRRDADGYLATDAADRGARVAEHSAQDAAELLTDRLWLGMRTSDGLLAADLAVAPGVTEWALASGLAERRGDRICPTLDGYCFADGIAEKITVARSRRR